MVKTIDVNYDFRKLLSQAIIYSENKQFFQNALLSGKKMNL